MALSLNSTITDHLQWVDRYDKYGHPSPDAELNYYLRKYQLHPREAVVMLDAFRKLEHEFRAAGGNPGYWMHIGDQIMREVERELGPRHRNTGINVKPECQHLDLDEEDGIEFCPDCGKTGDDLCL